MMEEWKVERTVCGKSARKIPGFAVQMKIPRYNAGFVKVRREDWQARVNFLFA